jgi:hypothetical protein
MVRLRGWCLVAAAVLMCAGCVAAATPTAIPPTAPLITSTVPATITPAPSATPLTIITPTATGGPTAAGSPTAAETTPAAGQPTATEASATPGGQATTPATAQTPSGTGTPGPITIMHFTSSPAEIQPGQPVTLSWQVSAADDVTIHRLDVRGRLGEWYNVPVSGTLTLDTSPALRESVEFLLFAAAGGAQANARASTRILCPDTWFFNSPPASCPAGPAETTVMQAQHFQRGMMIWTLAGDRIYALYADGGTNAWQIFPNGWFAGMPETDPSIEPPPGLFQPVRGFGVAWREGYGPPSPAPRDRLGWATVEEFGVPNARVQCEYAVYPRCWLSGPGGAVLVLEPEGSAWRTWP